MASEEIRVVENTSAEPEVIRVADKEGDRPTSNSQQRNRTRIGETCNKQ
jgi:hypothetical protein